MKESRNWPSGRSEARPCSVGLSAGPDSFSSASAAAAQCRRCPLVAASRLGRGKEKHTGNRGQGGRGQLKVTRRRFFPCLRIAVAGLFPGSRWAGGIRRRFRHQRLAGVGMRGQGLQKSGSRAPQGELVAQRVADKIMQPRRLAKAYLRLRRVHVHVHFFRRHVEEQQHHGKRSGREECCGTPR